MIDNPYHTVTSRSRRKFCSHDLFLQRALQICDHEIDQLRRRVQTSRNEAKHTKRPQHQSHINRTIAEPAHKALVQAAEPEEPLLILRRH